MLSLRHTLSSTAVVLCLATGVSACGGGGGEGAGDAAAPEATPAAATTTGQSSSATPLTQQQAMAIQLGTPRARAQARLGDPLPVSDYALTPAERRNCEYHPMKTADGRTSYDNVWRYCFKDGELYTFSTAPSRKAVGPDADAKPTGKGGKALTRSAE